MEGRTATIIPRLDLCTLFDQQACHVEGVPTGSLVQRRKAAIIPRIDIISPSNKRTCDVNSVLLCSTVKLPAFKVQLLDIRKALLLELFEVVD